MHFGFKLLFASLIIILLFLSCNGDNVIPEGYYKVSITGESCRLIAQIKGSKTTRELDKYKYLYIKNLPEELEVIGAEFYFKGWEEAEPPTACLGNTHFPDLTINVNNISLQKP